jgi:hypothetical protein
MGCALYLVGASLDAKEQARRTLTSSGRCKAFISYSFDEDLCCSIVNEAQARLWYLHPPLRGDP